MITESRAELVALLQAWTAAAERMTRGADAGPVGAVGGIPEAPPDDTGEAIGLSPARLTLTFGVGPVAVHRRRGPRPLRPRRPRARRARRPARVRRRRPRPRSAAAATSCVQACADDPQVAVHAVRNLARIGFGVVRVRWSQLGFGRTSSTSTAQTTPAQPHGLQGRHAPTSPREDADLLDEHVWARRRRRPRVDGRRQLPRRPPDPHDRSRRGTAPRSLEQEAIIGRTKGEGAPLSGGARVHRAGLRRHRRRRRAADAGRQRTCGSRTRRRTPARTCCVAATASSTAPTGSAGSTPGCSSWPTSATRARPFVPVQKQLAAQRRAQRVPRARRARACTPYRPARSPAPTGRRACSPDRARRCVISDVSWRR